MTVSYNLDISSSKAFTFLRIVFRWRGSVWKSVLNELIAWTVLYYCIFAIYRFALDEDEQKAFEHIAGHIDERVGLLPLTFMLGFFVTIVADRWKNIFANIGFVDSTAFFVNTYIQGSHSETRLARRNIIRYLCLTQVLVLRDISIQVRKRFPNMDTLVESGLLHRHELEMMEEVKNGFAKYWMPINWIFAICYHLRKKEAIAADVLLNGLLHEVNAYREKLQQLCNYDWVPVPLAYPQVVFLAVRIYFLLCLFGRQYRWHENAATQNQVDRFLPLITMLQFIFVMGWAKVAEALLNPLGEDDDDFECNYIIDRNIAIAMTMVDQCHAQVPKCVDASGANGLLSPMYPEQPNGAPHHRPLVGSATLSHLPQEREQVHMVRRQLSETPDGQPDTRRHSNFITRRLSTIPFGRLRSVRHSVPSRQQSASRVRPSDLDVRVLGAWYNEDMPSQLEQGKQPRPATDISPGALSVATAPEEGSHLPLSPSKSLLQQHLDTVEEDDGTQNDGSTGASTLVEFALGDAEGEAKMAEQGGNGECNGIN